MGTTDNTSSQGEDIARRAEGLRSWAKGMYTTAAAAEMLIRFGNGRLLTGPWVEFDEDWDRYWFNTELVDEAGWLSGGEFRFLKLAAAIAEPSRSVSLSDLVPGLDRDALALLLAAIAHAGGSHEHSEFVFDDNRRPTGLRRLTSLFEWPEVEQ